MSSIIFSGATFTNDDYNSYIDIEDLAENMQAVYAARKFREEYTAVNFGRYTQYTTIQYPDNFGGMFIDENNVLHINYVGDKAEFSGNRNVCDYIVFVPVQFSYNELYRIVELLRYVAEIYNINSFAVNEITNRVDVSAPVENRDSLIVFLMNNLHGFDVSAIEFTEASEFVQSNLPAGTGIYYFTTGYNAIRGNGRAGFVTAAHVVSPDEYVVFNRSIIGRASRTLWRFQGDMDAAFVEYMPIRNNATPLTVGGFHTHGGYRSLHIAGLETRQQITVGMQVVSHGIRSGWRTGVVSSRSSNETMNGVNFTRQIVLTMRSAQGDSGGPVLRQWSTVVLPGMPAPAGVMGIVIGGRANAGQTLVSSAELINERFNLTTIIR